MTQSLSRLAIGVLVLLTIRPAGAQLPKVERGPYLTYGEITRAVEDVEAEYPSDVALYEDLGQVGVELTGFPYFPGYNMDYLPLPGFYIDWLYQHRGILAFTVEMGLFYNYLNAPDHLPEEQANELRMLEWHDRHPKRKLFLQWQSYEHPQLGRVEIGGWNEVLESNPPPAVLDSISTQITRFALEQMERIPRLEINGARVRQLEDGLYEVSATIHNAGRVSTSIMRMGRDTHPEAGVRVRLTGSDDLSFIVGKSYEKIGHLEAHRGREVMEWVVRTGASRLTLEAFSKRGLWESTNLRLSER